MSKKQQEQKVDEKSTKESKEFEKLDKELDKVANIENDEKMAPPKGTGKPPVDENCIYIEGLPEKKKKVEELIQEKKNNPGVIQDGESGMVILEDGPKFVIDNQYVPADEARIILQERKVITEWVKLERLKKGIKDEDNN